MYDFTQYLQAKAVTVLVTLQPFPVKRLPNHLSLIIIVIKVKTAQCQTDRQTEIKCDRCKRSAGDIQMYSDCIYEMCTDMHAI